MKYFEVTNPYYALIGAEDDLEAKRIYEYEVADVEDEDLFYAELQVVSEEYVRAQLYPYEYEIDIDNELREGGVLVFDGSLV